MAKHGKKRIVESPQYMKFSFVDTPWKRFCNLIQKTISDNLYGQPDYSIDERNGVYVVEVFGLNDADTMFILEEFKKNLEEVGIQSRITKYNELIATKQDVTDAFEPLITESVNRKTLTESYEPITFRAFITNLGKYNEGELVGEWVEFPIDEEDFQTVLDRIGISPEYEEWFVSDYDCSLNSFDWQDLGEYPSYETLNDFGELLESIDDVEAVDNVFEVASSLEEAIEGLDTGSYIYHSGITSNTDWGNYIVDNYYGGIDNLDMDTIAQYFDYEALGRELDFDSYGDNDDLNAGEYWCGDEDASNTEIGEAYVDDLGIEGVANPENYFDYESFGRDNAGDCTFTKDGLVEQL